MIAVIARSTKKLLFKTDFRHCTNDMATTTFCQTGRRLRKESVDVSGQNDQESNQQPSLSPMHEDRETRRPVADRQPNRHLQVGFSGESSSRCGRSHDVASRQHRSSGMACHIRQTRPRLNLTGPNLTSTVLQLVNNSHPQPAATKPGDQR